MRAQSARLVILTTNLWQKALKTYPDGENERGYKVRILLHLLPDRDTDRAVSGEIQADREDLK